MTSLPHPYRTSERPEGAEPATFERETPRVVIGTQDPDATRAVVARLKIVALMWLLMLLVIAIRMSSTQ